MSEENEVIENENTDEISVEDRARQLGWHPKEEYKGDPERHLSAEDFIKRGEEELPLLRSNLRKIQDDLAKQQKEFQQTTAEFKEWHESSVRQAKVEAYERAKAEIEAKKLQAVEDGDRDAYEAATKEESKLKAPDEPKKEEPKANDPDPAFNEFVKSNPWYTEYPELAVEADSIGVNLWQSGKFKSTSEVMEQVSKSIQRKYPHYFTNPQRSAEPAVNEEGDPGSSRRTKAKSYDNLPKAAKEACDRFIRLGMISSKQEYVDGYDWS